MGNFLEFLKNNWIVVLLAILVIFSLIGYLIEKHNLSQNKREVKSEKKNIDNKLVDMQTYYTDDIVYENVKEESDIHKIVSKQDNKLETNKLVDINTEQEIIDSIEEIASNKNMILDESDKAILEKSAIDDLKEEFENLDYKIDKIKKPKVCPKVNTNIDLPEIRLDDDNDIWN